MVSLSPTSDTIMQLTDDDIGKEIVFTSLDKDYMHGTAYVWYGNVHLKVNRNHVGWFAVSDETGTEWVAIEHTYDAAIASLVWYAYKCLDNDFGGSEEITYRDTFSAAPKYTSLEQAKFAAKCNWTYQSAIDNGMYLRVHDEMYLVDGKEELHLCEL